jgi:hypothetical protein
VEGLLGVLAGEGDEAGLPGDDPLEPDALEARAWLSPTRAGAT